MSELHAQPLQRFANHAIHVAAPDCAPGWSLQRRWRQRSRYAAAPLPPALHAGKAAARTRVAHSSSAVQRAYSTGASAKHPKRITSAARSPRGNDNEKRHPAFHAQNPLDSVNLGFLPLISVPPRVHGRRDGFFLPRSHLLAASPPDRRRAPAVPGPCAARTLCLRPLSCSRYSRVSSPDFGAKRMPTSAPIPMPTRK